MKMEKLFEGEELLLFLRIISEINVDIWKFEGMEGRKIVIVTN